MKFSLKQLLLGMVFVALFTGGMAMAYRGSNVAFGLVSSLMTLPVLLLLYAVSHLLLAKVAGTIHRGKSLPAAPLGGELESRQPEETAT